MTLSLGLRRVLSVLAFGAVFGVGGWSLASMRVETEITAFLPAQEDADLAAIVRAVTTSDLTRTVTLTVEADDVDAAAAGAAELASALEAHDEVAWIRRGPDAGLERAFYEAYFPRRFGLVADRPDQVTLDAEDLDRRLTRLRAELGGPTGPFVRRIAPEDPWLVFMEYVERLRDALEGELAVRDGTFVSSDGSGEDTRHFGVVLLASRHSPFDGPHARALVEGIDEAAAPLRARGLTVEMASVHRIAVASEATIKADIQRVSVFGSLAVVLLLLVVFRDPRTLFLAGAPLVGGVFAGATAVHLGFGQVHGLTLAFGATLVGVALDYVAHLLNHAYLAPAEGGVTATARHLRPGLLLGAGTTIAGLIGLAWTSFPGIRQMAVFTSVGVAVAVSLTLFALPPLLPTPRTSRLHRWLGERCAGLLARARQRRRALLLLPVLALGLAAGITQVRWQDDIRAIDPTDAALRAEDEVVRGRVARLDTGRFLVAMGDDLEQALQRNDALHDRLRAAVDEGAIERVRSLHALLPSAARQRAVLGAIPPDAWTRTEAALEAKGFVAPPFAPLREAIEQARAEFDPLTWDTLASAGAIDQDEGPLARLAAMHRVPLEDGVGILTFVRGGELATLESIAGELEGVRAVDQGALMARAYAGFRTRTLQLMLVGLVFVLLMVVARYRRVGHALAAYLPALLAAAATLGLLGWLGIEANLLHVVTLLLVLSMGVDYGVFMVESERSGGEDGPATVVSLGMACASTVASFGVLALSGSGALRALGTTAAIGVGISLLLAPTAWLLLRSRSRAGSSASGERS